MIKKFFFVSFILFFYASPSISQQVIDGDTIKIDNKIYRLFGIDTPEKNQLCMTNNLQWACGLVATSELIKLVSGKEIICEKKSTDQYNRTIAVCFVEGTDIGKAMVESGWALAYREYSVDYVDSEKRAKSKKFGLWSSDFEKPWQLRKLGNNLEKTNIDAKSKSECKIKGNISSKGTKIYHKPGGTYYSRTIIDESKGERWFCSSTKAENAGWRASKR